MEHRPQLNRGQSFPGPLLGQPNFRSHYESAYQVWPSQFNYGTVRNIFSEYGFIKPTSVLPQPFTGQKSVFFHFDSLNDITVKANDKVLFVLKKGSEDRPSASKVWRLGKKKQCQHSGRNLGRIISFEPTGGFIEVFNLREDGFPYQNVFYSTSSIKCAGLVMEVGDILEFTLKPAKRYNADWFACQVSIKKLKPRSDKQIVTFTQALKKELMNLDIYCSDNILELLNSNAYWELLGQYSCNNISGAMELIMAVLLLKEKSELWMDSFKRCLCVLFNTQLFSTQNGKLVELLSNSWDVIDESQRGLIYKFLKMVVDVVPEKASIVDPLIRTALSMGSVGFGTVMFYINKKLSELDCVDDNDAQWNRLPPVPSANELLLPASQVENLSPVKESGPYDNPEEYFNTCYRLLRADCFDGLPQGIQDLLRGTLDARDMNTFTGITLEGINVGDYHRCLSFALKINPTTKIKDWRLTSSLMSGSLVCISPGGHFEDIIWATVVEKDVQLLNKKQIVWVSLCTGNKNCNEAEFVSIMQGRPANIIMAESPVYYVAYDPVLRSLQAMPPDHMAFKEELVYMEGPKRLDCQEDSQIKSPITQWSWTKGGHLSNPFKDFSDVKASKTMTESDLKGDELKRIIRDLDESQSEAFLYCLDKRICVIQGPPGTGKTYIGTKLVEFLLSETTSPVLVLTYKNHALDEFLKHIIEITDNVVRVGGGSKEPLLSKFNLREKRKKHPKSHLYSLYEIVDQSNYLLLSQLKMLKKQIFCTAQEFIKSLQASQLESFLKNCPWQKIVGRDGKQIWKESEVMYRFVKAKDLLNDVDINGKPGGKTGFLIKELMDAIESAVEFWMPSMQFIKSYCLSQRSMANKLKSNKPPKKSIKKRNDKLVKGTKDDDNQEDELEIKEMEEERMVHSPGSSDRKISWDVSVQKDAYAGCFVRNMKQANGIPGSISNKMGNIWNLADHERILLAQALLYNSRLELEQEIEKNIKEYKQVLSCLDEQEKALRLKILRKAEVVAMTITGASLNQEVLKKLRPEVIIVEEAAEVLEPQLMGLLGPWVKHLILIGDHKQLKPMVHSHRLVRDYHFDLSMMERLINNGYPYVTLERQSRMLPEMAALLKDIYPKLKNNLHLVGKNRKIDFAQPIYFWDHRNEENSGSRSFSNVAEAERVIALANIFVLQGFRKRTTILAAYRGQTRLLRKMWKEKTKVDHPVKEGGDKKVKETQPKKTSVEGER